MAQAIVIGSGGGGGSSTDRFAPKYMVGNESNGDTAAAYAASGFTYFSDPGDGSGIEAALAAAALVPGDISVRPGVYDFSIGSVVMPLTVPAGVRICGSGVGSCELRSSTSGDQGIFVLADTGIGVQDFSFVVQSSGEAIYLGSIAAIRNASNGLFNYILRCKFTLTLAGSSVLRAAIYDQGGLFVERCDATGPAIGGFDPESWISFVLYGQSSNARLLIRDSNTEGFDVPVLLTEDAGADDVLIQNLFCNQFEQYAVYQSGTGFIGISDSYFLTEMTVQGVVSYGGVSIGYSGFSGSYIRDSKFFVGTLQSNAAVFLRSGDSGTGYTRIEDNLFRWFSSSAVITVGTPSGSCSYNIIQGNQIFNVRDGGLGVLIANNGVISNIVSDNVIVATTPISNGSGTTQISGNTP